MSTAVKTKVNEKPILFSGPMVRAILEGRKTQTRRVIKFPHNYNPILYLGVVADLHVWEGVDKWGGQLACPYGLAGDRLWVRETFTFGDTAPSDFETNRRVVIFRADDEEHPEAFEKKNGGPGWVPGIFMPRERSRITLDITDIRAERLMDITDTDIRAEGIGVVDDGTGNVRAAWANGWNAINEKRGYSWLHNPWVWVIKFKQ